VEQLFDFSHYQAPDKSEDEQSEVKPPQNHPTNPNTQGDVEQSDDEPVTPKPQHLPIFNFGGEA
jgi:hypothetical protein